MDIEPMSEATHPYGDALELDYKGNSIRALMVNGVPWFELGGVCDALRPFGDLEEVVGSRGFPVFAQMKAGETDSPDDVTLLSPVGVWYLTTLMDSPEKGQDIAAWAKREAARLCPNPTEGDPAVFLTILDVEGRKELPPYPWRFSSRRSEFLDLRDSAEWVYRDHPNLLHPPRPQSVENARAENIADGVVVVVARRREIGKPGDAIARQKAAGSTRPPPILPPYDQRPIGLKVPRAT